MHIETLGHGPDLVLIHGWALHGGVFAPLAERLASRFRLHLVDLPGHGYSRDPAETLGPAGGASAIASRNSDAAGPANVFGMPSIRSCRPSAASCAPVALIRSSSFGGSTAVPRTWLWINMAR